MIPTFTESIQEKVITSFLGNNLVLALINYPELGLTDAPTQDEYELRTSFNLDNINVYEIGGAGLNGYQRQIINIDPNLIVGTNIKRVITTVEFEAVGAAMEPFTHIVAIQAANLVEATEENGYNRGDSQGTVIFVEPVKDGPIELQAETVFEYTLTLVSNISVI